LTGPVAEDIQRSPGFKLVARAVAPSVFWLDLPDQWDPKSPWHDRRVRQAASLAIDRQALNQAETLGFSKPTGSLIPRALEFSKFFEPDPYDPPKAKRLLAEAGYPNGFDAGDLYPWPPYFSMVEALGGYLGTVGIRTRMRTMERAAFYSALATKKLKGLCVCIDAVYGNASTRMAELVPSDGAFAYGGYPDIDALYKQQARETDRKKREAMLHQIQRLLYERVRFGTIYEYIWPSGIGPRVAEPALMLIDPYPWSAPLEDVRLKKN
jgi:peptide/nickel transport system substrate-binding protein